MADSLLQTEDPIQIDENKNYLEELVGENKKFKDTEALAKGKFYADQQVELLKKRYDEIYNDSIKQRETINSQARLEELIDQLSKAQPNRETTIAETEKPTLKPEDIEAIAERKYQEIDAARKQQTNYQMVVNKLKEKYGENYTTPYKQQIENLGLTDAYATDLAKNYPQVFLKTLGLDQQPVQETFQAPQRSSQRNDSFAPSGAKERTWSYYQALKAKDPMLYYDRKTSIQMQEDAIRLGDKCKDGDYLVYGD